MEKTPNQLKSYNYAKNTIKSIVSGRLYFNTNNRIDLVKAINIMNALIEENLLTEEEANDYYTTVRTMRFHLEREYFAKYKDSICKYIEMLSPRGKVLLYKYVVKYQEEYFKRLFVNMFASESSKRALLEEFIKAFGASKEMNRYLNFA